MREQERWGRERKGEVRGQTKREVRGERKSEGKGKGKIDGGRMGENRSEREWAEDVGGAE